MMKIRNKLLASLMCLGMLTGCGNNAENEPVEESTKVETSQEEVKEENKEPDETKDVVSEVNYDEIVEKAKGTSVNLYGWGGDDKRNQWLDDYIIPKMKEDYDIDVNRVGMDIDEILNLMVAEKDSEDGDVDVVWINGENFENAKNNGLLFGPITQVLPNFNDYVDGEDEGIKYDFGEPVENMEAPYGGAQFVFMYDSSKIDNPPKNAEELLELAKANPGKITYASLPDFTGSAFIRNIISDIQGYEDFMDKDLTKEELRKMLKPTIDYLNELKPYLWNEGQSYPADNPTLTNMFADGELIMAMSYNPNAASTGVVDGQFNENVRTAVFDKGTIANTHFLAISKGSSNKDAATVLINLILSPEAQISKADPEVLGDLPIIDYNKLTDDQKKMYDEIPSGEYTLSTKELEEHRIPEMPANIVPLIEEIWEEEVLN
ncbi:MAG: ABC transporter substrate-binding protein [Anaerococcus sp.]|uniref:ABC transporter substrate-binding protein n=2 Tax=Peptoniphilaceae TaxID=1570339 RepID=A0A2I1M9J9_9FIRM|nr:ABC transporter substrate-binding protein [Anaerococcus sp.]PKZ16798.1 ABC transporter substrate-binding protein [Anaerococcus octavius]